MNMRRMRNFYLKMASRDIFAFHIWHSRQECQIAEQIFITVWQTKWRPKADTPFPRSLSPITFFLLLFGAGETGSNFKLQHWQNKYHNNKRLRNAKCVGNANFHCICMWWLEWDASYGERAKERLTKRCFILAKQVANKLVCSLWFLGMLVLCLSIVILWSIFIWLLLSSIFHLGFLINLWFPGNLVLHLTRISLWFTIIKWWKV